MHAVDEEKDRHSEEEDGDEELERWIALGNMCRLRLCLRFSVSARVWVRRLIKAAVVMR